LVEGSAQAAAARKSKMLNWRGKVLNWRGKVLNWRGKVLNRRGAPKMASWPANFAE